MKFIPQQLRKDLEFRFDSIRKHMHADGIDATLVSSNSNIFYTTGRFFRGYVYIPLSGNPLWFIIRPDIYEKEPDIVIIRKPEQIAEILADKGFKAPSVIGLELDSLTYNEAGRLHKIFPDSSLGNGSVALRRARMVKTDLEIKLMKEDGLHQSEAYRRVTRLYKEDMTDVQFQIEIEKAMRLEGSLGFVRTSGNLMDINLGSVIAGKNADNPSPYDFAMGGAGVDPSLPGGANGTTIKHGEAIMVDMCGSFNGYQTDMTRVWSLGDLPRLAIKAHNCSIRILHACESMGKPGTKVSALYEKAMEIVNSEKLEDYFMGHRQKAAFIGHGVGIDLNEMPVVTPRSKDILENNMTIALEPKFVIPEVGALGIENTYVVTPDGLKTLTIFPEEIQEL